MCKAMALFHAFTGSDSTSSFKFKGKRFCWNVSNDMPELIFASIADNPFNISPELKDIAFRFVCNLYLKESPENGDVDQTRMRVFSHRTRDVERIPPTSDALSQHLERSVFQASIWISAHKAMMPPLNPIDYGWLEKDGKLVPKWITLPLARDVFSLDVKCTCTLTCSSCKCKKANLKCSRLCKCKCPM